MAQNYVKYQKALFCAFLGYSHKETEMMTAEDYIDNTLILRSVLKLWHAPFQKE